MTARLIPANNLAALALLDFEPPCDSDDGSAARWAARLATNCAHLPAVVLACDSCLTYARSLPHPVCGACHCRVSVVSVEPLRGAS